MTFLRSLLLGFSLSGPLLADPTPEEIITQSLKNLERVDSISFSCQRGNESYTCSEMPPFYQVHYRSYNEQKNYLFEWLTGFGGMGGYRLSLTTRQMEVQKAAFDDFTHSLVSKNWIPLDAYDFVLTPKDKGKSLRLAQLKAAETLKLAASRAIEVNNPNNPYLRIQDSICLEFGGCYDSRLEIPVNMRVYFSTTHGFFPIAWEKLDKQGNGLLAYFAGEIANLPVSQSQVFMPRKFHLRNLEICRVKNIKPPSNAKPTEVFLKGIDEIYNFSTLEINTLQKEDFDPDPSKAEHLVDLDADTVIRIPR
jgi:hypothetical protein